MKFYQIILFVVVAVYQANGECQCGIFTIGPNEENRHEIHLSSTSPQSCDRLEVDQLCRDFCYQEFSNLTVSGDLHAISPTFNMTSSEFFCNKLKKEMQDEWLAGFYRWCQTSWKFVGRKANNMLCCSTLGASLRCKENREFLEAATTNVLKAAEDLEPNSTEIRQRRETLSEKGLEEDDEFDEKSEDDLEERSNVTARLEGDSSKENITRFDRHRRSIADDKRENRSEEIRSELKEADIISPLKATELPSAEKREEEEIITTLLPITLAPQPDAVVASHKPASTLNKRNAPVIKTDNLLSLVTHQVTDNLPTTSSRPLEVTAEFLETKKEEDTKLKDIIGGRRGGQEQHASTESWHSTTSGGTEKLRPSSASSETTLARE